MVMKYLETTKYIFIVVLFTIYATSGFAQIGIKTLDPTSAVDVNGDLRIREITQSNSTNDRYLVIDENGLVKTSLVTPPLLRAYLNNDFTAGDDASKIYIVNDLNVVDGLSSQIDAVNGILTPSISGIYAIETTLTIATTNAAPATKNTVFGIVDNATGKWVMRFSIPSLFVYYLGADSPQGSAYSFTGAVELTEGNKYSFGITGDMKILANPTGSSGGGIGTDLSIELIKNKE